MSSVGPRNDGRTVRIGALVPLAPPGWREAGEHLLAGLELGLHDVNEEGGIAGRPLELLVRDTAADPQRAAAAVDDLAGLGVTALAGEFHSVAARAVAERADALGLPFLCSSAVMDMLAEQPTEWVARLAPAQSYSWNVYANYLLDAGHRRIAVVADTSVYWAAGTRILRDFIAVRGGALIELGAGDFEPAGLRDDLVASGVTALLLLVGHPEPAMSIARSVRRDPRLAGIMIGAPAGQPEFDSWAAELGAHGGGVPFLRYRPERLGPLGARVEAALCKSPGKSPSFVALEGYDTVVVLAALLRSHRESGGRISDAWSRIAVDGTRGRIGFSRPPGLNVWQWAWPPVQVADRDPAQLDQFRTLYTQSALSA